MPEFAVLFPEVNAYLELTYQCLDGNTKDEIDKLQVGDYESLFSELSVGNVANLVEVLGFPLKNRIRLAQIISRVISLLNPLFIKEK